MTDQYHLHILKPAIIRTIECHIFNDEWKWKYFFTIYNNKVVCLNCNSSVAVFKDYNLKRHFETKHASYKQNLNEAKKNKPQIS